MGKGKEASEASHFWQQEFLVGRPCPVVVQRASVGLATFHASQKPKAQPSAHLLRAWPRKAGKKRPGAASPRPGRDSPPAPTTPGRLGAPAPAPPLLAKEAPGPRAAHVGWQSRRRDALRGAGDEPAGRAPLQRPAGQAVLGGGGRSGQARGAGERDGEERAADGAGRLGRALRPADRLLHRRGGLGRAEQGAQRAPFRLPHAGAGARRRQDPHSVLSPGIVADRQEWDRHDFLVRRAESVREANSRGAPAPAATSLL